MQLTAEQILHAGLALPEVDRVRLADMLYRSVGRGSATEPFGRDVLASELDRRWKAFQAGEEGVPEEEVMAKLDALVDA